MRLAGRCVEHRDEGTALGLYARYLAELPWVPHAMLLNPELEWCEYFDGGVEVVAHSGSDPCAVRFEFDHGGDIVRASPATHGLAPAPWVVAYTDYACVGGLRVPTRATAYWGSGEGRFEAWCGVLTMLELDHDGSGEILPTARAGSEAGHRRLCALRA
jgi:hypothetical protein